MVRYGARISLAGNGEAGTPRGATPPWNPAAPAVCASTMRRYITMGMDTRYTFQTMFKAMGNPSQVPACHRIIFCWQHRIGAF
jgi:hypothetical protein